LLEFPRHCGLGITRHCERNGVKRGSA